MNRETHDWSRHWGHAGALGLGAATVDAGYYVSPEQFAAERETLFRKIWMPVARVEELPEPGSFLRREIPPLATEAVLVRGKDGVIRAFYNACPHRGVALVRECKGRTGLFVCPYHAWSFGTDGKLKGLPGAEDFPQVDKAATGLTPIHADIWNGFVFLNFDAEPEQSLADYLGDFATSFGDLPFENYPDVIEIVQDIDANWKTLVDASNEGYHVNVLHRHTLGEQLTTPENPQNNFYDPVFAPPHASAMTQANAGWRPDRQPVVQFVYEAAAYKVQPGLAQDGEKGRRTFADHPMINRVGLPAFSVESTMLFPFTVLQMLTDRYIWFQYWPLSEGRTRFVLRLYGPAAPQSWRQRFADSHMIAYSRDIVTEDATVTQFQQAGLRSGGIKQVNLGDNEYMLRFHHEMVQRYLAR